MRRMQAIVEDDSVGDELMSSEKMIVWVMS